MRKLDPSKPDHPTTDKATANLIVALQEFLSAKFLNPADGSTLELLKVRFPELGFGYDTHLTFIHRFTIDVQDEWWLTMQSTGPLTITDDPEWKKPHLRIQPVENQ